MVRRSTWILIVVLLGLLGVTFLLQKQKASQSEAPATPSSSVPVFGVAAGEPSAIRVENASGDSVEIVRAPEGIWEVKVPMVAEADQAAAEAAATQVGALRSLSTVSLAPAVIGLDRPAYAMTFTFAKGETHKLLIGAQTPIQDGYYGQVDGATIQVVDKNGVDALIGLIQAPPYLPTPTPAASARPTVSPTSALESSPATEGPSAATSAP